MGEKDITQKTLEAYNDVFSDIVNGLLFQGAQVLQENELTDAQPFSMYKASGERHEQIRDVAKYWKEPDAEQVSVRIAFLGIENQTKFDRDMPLRVIGYDGAAYRSELEENERYPVVTLVLYFGKRPWGKVHSLYDVIKVPDRLKPFVSDYRINVFDIPHLPEEAISYFHSDFRIVVDYFVHSRINPAYRPENADKFRHVDELLATMAVLTQDHRYTEVLNEEGGKPENMCELLDRVQAEGERIGFEKGEQIGIEKGEQIGIEKGIEMTRIKTLKELITQLKLSEKEAMDFMKIPESEREKYRKLLRMAVS